MTSPSKRQKRVVQVFNRGVAVQLLVNHVYHGLEGVVVEANDDREDAMVLVFPTTEPTMFSELVFLPDIPYTHMRLTEKQFSAGDEVIWVNLERRSVEQKAQIMLESEGETSGQLPLRMAFTTVAQESYAPFRVWTEKLQPSRDVLHFHQLDMLDALCSPVDKKLSSEDEGIEAFFNVSQQDYVDNHTVCNALHRMVAETGLGTSTCHLGVRLGASIFNISIFRHRWDYSSICLFDCATGQVTPIQAFPKTQCLDLHLCHHSALTSVTTFPPHYAAVRVDQRDVVNLLDVTSDSRMFKRVLRTAHIPEMTKIKRVEAIVHFPRYVEYISHACQASKQRGWWTCARKERWLMHGTSHKNAMSIVEHGFNVLHCRRTAYGVGVYATSSLDTARYYSSDNTVILCRTFVGMVTKDNINPRSFIPPPGFDTTTDATETIFCVFKPQLIVPEYIITLEDALCSSQSSIC